MKVKCKKCGAKIERDEAFKVVKQTEKTKANHYYCSEDEYNSIIKEQEDKYRCYDTIKKIINMKMITPAWIKNINTIREFYDYDVIDKCFKDNEDTISWSLNNKDFKNEHAKSRYVLAIITNNIEDTYKKHIKDIEEMNRLFTKNENNEIDIDILNEEPIQISKKRKNENDISMFLD